MGSQMLIQGPKFPTLISCLFWTKKRVKYSPFFPNLMGSGTHWSKIDGFPGTHGIHANGAPGVLNLSILNFPNSTMPRGNFNLCTWTYCMFIRSYIVCTWLLHSRIEENISWLQSGNNKSLIYILSFTFNVKHAFKEGPEKLSNITPWHDTRTLRICLRENTYW